MTAPNEGDAVRVTFEATYNESSDSGHWLLVGTTEAWVPSSAEITVLAPPVKVGDFVTADNIGQLPYMSIIATDGSVAWSKLSDGWNCAGMDNTDYYSDEALTANRHQNATLRVLRIGFGS